MFGGSAGLPYDAQVRVPHLLLLGFALLVPAVDTTAAQDAAATPTATAASRRPRASRRSRAPRIVASFPGFRMNPDGTSRCFVHLSSNVEATTRSSPRRFEVTLPGAVVLVRNHLHPLETRFFDTPMLRAKLERRGRGNLALVVELRADVTPTMHVDPSSGGGVDVVVELPAGDFVDGPPQIGGSVRLSESETDGYAGSTGVGRIEERERASAPADDTAARGRTTSQPDAGASRPRAAEPPTGEDDERPPMFGGGR